MHSTKYAQCLCLLFVVIGGELAQAQLTGGTGPGGFTTTGATSDITLWLRGDAGITKDGANLVSTWADQSGRANHVTQAVTTRQPLQNLTQNNVPVVRFGGGNVADPVLNAEVMSTAGAVAVSSVFIATTPRGQFDCCNPIIANSTPYLSLRYSPFSWENPGNGDDVVNPAGSEMRINGAVQGVNPASPLNTPIILSAERGGAAANFTNFRIAQHVGLESRSYNGDIGEVLVFNRLLNQAEETIVDNHLASKFGVALNTGGGALDRYTGDTGGNGNRDFGVFGIGQASDGSNVTNAGADGFGFEAVSGLGNGEFVMAGHDGTPNSLNLVNGTGQMSREWFVDLNGTTAVLNLAFDISDSGLSPLANQQYQFDLLASTDGVTYQSLRSDGVLSGDRIVFSNFNTAGAPNGFLTLGVTAVPEPTSLAFWVVLCSAGVVMAMRRKSAAHSRT